MKDLSNKKILIIHDRFQFRGGGERLVLDLARGLGADIATEFWTDQTYDRAEAPGKVYVLDEGEPAQIVWRYFRAHYNFWFKTKSFINEYGLVIFSGNNCLSAAFNLRANTPRLLYCHAPVRYVYDLFEKRRRDESSPLKRFVYYDIGKWMIRGIYQAGLARMHGHVIANARNVRKRLQRFCRTDATVIYPPIKTDRFQWIAQGDYYLSFARVEELKRVDDIVRAFQQLPDKKLVIASSGPDIEKIRAMSNGYANIDVRGWVEHDELADLVGRCIATIYIPIDEDFGMSPVEGMAAGKPCIGVADGGLPESIEDGVTGMLISKDYSLEELVAAIEKLAPDEALKMKDACIAKAQIFSEEKFVTAMKQYIEQI